MIDLHTVYAIAKLARLHLSDAEAEQYQKQLSPILDYIAKLGELNTDQVEATAHAFETATPLREDVAKVSPVSTQVLERGPDHEDRFFRVPKVL